MELGFESCDRRYSFEKHVQQECKFEVGKLFGAQVNSVVVPNLFVNTTNTPD